MLRKVLLLLDEKFSEHSKQHGLKRNFWLKFQTIWCKFGIKAKICRVNSNPPAPLPWNSSFKDSVNIIYKNVILTLTELNHKALRRLFIIDDSNDLTHR